MKTEPFATKGRFKLFIKQDEDPQAPNEYGDKNLFLIAKHRDFYIPPSEKQRNFEIQDEIDERKKTHHIFPLEAYIHSGVVLAISGEGDFPDRRWDVSQLGVIFVAKSEWRTKKQARKAAEALISEWNQYLSGDVWGYVVEDENGEHQESCWGYYGKENCETEGKSMLNAVAKNADEIPTLKAIGVE